MTPSIAKWVERGYPYVTGLIAAGAILKYGPDLALWAAANSIELKDFFSAIFDISAILTAFLFSFFGLAMAPGGGFIERIFKTKTFRLFLRYIAEALGLGAALTIGCIPFMVAEIHPTTWNDAANWFMAAWGFLCVSAMLAFYRVASVFLIWIRQRSAAISFTPA